MSPKPGVMASAQNLAEAHAFLVRPDSVLELFDRIVRAWQALRGRGFSSLDASSVAAIFRAEGALPTQWLPALRTSPLRPPGP